MEQYYFLKINGINQGPYKLDDLKKQDIQSDDLVWRDNNEWVKASDIEELRDIFIAKSPPKSNANLKNTNLYYFFQQAGTKKGPFKLQALKQLTIYFNDLVWRSDSDQWKKASDFDELSDIVIITPPPTPKEKKISEVNKNFTGKIIGQLVIGYVVASLLIGFISYSIASSSWENYLKETKNTYSNGRDESRNMIGGSDKTMADEALYSRYPTFVYGVNNESGYGYNQSFWFRPFKAFGSTIYLTEEEQKNSGLLMWNLFLSSFASLSFIFIIIGIIYYAIKRTDLADNPEINKGTPESSKVTNTVSEPVPVVIPRDVIIKQEIKSEKENIDAHTFLLYALGGLAVCIIILAFFINPLGFLILLVPASISLVPIFSSENSREKIKKLEEELKVISKTSSNIYSGELL